MQILAILIITSYLLLEQIFAASIPLYSACNLARNATDTCGRNAECVQVPGCSMGLCRCLEPNKAGQRFYATANGIDCAGSLAIGDKCNTTSDSGIVMPVRAECTNGTVSCESSLQPSGHFECIAPASWIKLPGVACVAGGTTDCNYLLGLECNRTTKCECIRGTVWTGQRCEPSSDERECRTHDDCKFGYGENAICLYNRRCMCGTGSIPVMYAQLSNANHKKFFINNFCAPERSTMNNLNGNCTVPGFPTGPKTFCAKNLVCHHCPEFGSAVDAGRCLNLAGFEYAGVRSKIYSSATVDALCRQN